MNPAFSLLFCSQVRHHPARLRAWALGTVIGLSGCGSGGPENPPPPAEEPDVVVNEVVAKNEGVWVDEVGETDDYIELYNRGKEPAQLAGLVLRDDSGAHALPDLTIAPRGTLLLWADDTPSQGERHLGFKISSDGERLRLETSDGKVLDDVKVPALGEHRAYQRIPDGSKHFVDCGWATPERKNGDTCGPPEPTTNLDDVQFEAYTWPAPWPASAGPLKLTELALRPARFVEVRNISDAEVDLGDFALTVSGHRVGTPWPAADAGQELEWADARLSPGETTVVEVSEDNVAELSEDPNFEGVVTLWNSAENAAIDRLDFISWPSNAILSEYPVGSGRYHFCTNATEGEANTACDELAERSVIDYERRILTPGDFHALAVGSDELETESVKFIVDLNAPDEVTFLSADWDLHFLFIRQAIDGLPGYDRCEEQGYKDFIAGWYAFSETEYFQVEGRRYLLGNLVRHAGSGLGTVEFAPGDAISAQQMQHAFFTVVARLPDPEKWAIRPQMDSQIQVVRGVEGEVPIIGPYAPYQNVTFQPLSRAVSYGTLRYVATDEIADANLGPRDIIVTDGVPLDIPLIGGIITEALQTPLSHVNVLSKARKTPNMALRNARTDERIAPFFDQLVRLEVRGSDFVLSLADSEEAIAYWKSRAPSGDKLVPRLDTSTRGVVPLEDRGLSDLPLVGGKASQLAELGHVALCSDQASIPPRAFAVPVVHSLEHFAASGAADLLAELEADPDFVADPAKRAEGLAQVRGLIEDFPLDPDVHDAVVAAIAERWPDRKVRFRSSSNVEDLAGFNGAGLYLSEGVEAEDVTNDVDDAIRSVWASLWRDRAYDERVYYNVDQSQIAMAVLVHPGFPSEKVNGVAISRNVLDPTQASRYYFNTQVGEALVTNPAPGIISEESSYDSRGWVKAQYYSRSTFSSDAAIMTEGENDALWCNLNRIHQHFRPLLDPDGENAWFAMDIEFKLVGEDRALVIKQARPYSFGTTGPDGWCDF